MSELANIYKQANDIVIKRYQEDPENRWRMFAINDCRAGKGEHTSVMNRFVEDVEIVVKELVEGVAKPSIPTAVAPTVSPNVKKSAPLPPAENRPKTPDNPAGIDLDWNWFYGQNI